MKSNKTGLENFFNNLLKFGIILGFGYILYIIYQQYFNKNTNNNFFDNNISNNLKKNWIDKYTTYKNKLLQSSHLIRKEINSQENNIDDISPDKALKLAEIYQYGKYGKNISYKKSLNYYQLAEQKGLKGPAFLGLGILYHEGCGDLEPNVDLAIDNYIKALKEGEYQALIKLGDLYAYGIHPSYLPNKIASKEIFELLLTIDCNNSIKNLAQEKLLNLMKESEEVDISMNIGSNIESSDRMGKYLPSDIIFTIKNNFPLSHPLGKYAGEKYYQGQIQKQGGNQGENQGGNQGVIQGGRGIQGENYLDIFQQIETPQNNDDIQRILWNDIHLAIDGADTDDIIRNEVWNQPVVIRNDKENVHDHNLNDYANISLQNLRKSYSGKEIVNKNQDINKVINLISNSDCSDLQKQHAKMIINNLNDFKHSRYNLSEKDVLSLVWNRINDPVNNERKDDLLKNLVLGLSSAVENDHIVCSTGKIMRILGSLDKCDAENYVELKPSWALNNEISDIIIKIRNDEMENLDDNIKDKYLNGIEDQDTKIFINNISEQVRNKCIKDYVDSGILSQSEIDLKLEPYLKEL